jgi:hypothetical protein
VSRWDAETRVVHTVSGIELLKKAYPDYSRLPKELAVLKAPKQALYPKGSLNPGGIFDNG